MSVHREMVRYYMREGRHEAAYHACEALLGYIEAQDEARSSEARHGNSKAQKESNGAQPSRNGPSEVQLGSSETEGGSSKIQPRPVNEENEKMQLVYLFMELACQNLPVEFRQRLSSKFTLAHAVEK